MKKILIFTAALLALAACNKDDIKEINRGQAIDFRMPLTKATEYTTNNINCFVVTAFTENGNLYFEDVTFTKNGEYFTSEDSYYWPATESLTFYAYNPNGTDLTGLVVDKTGVKISNYNPSKSISEQLDIIVATATGDKSNEQNGIEIKFQHQLSNIEVRALNTNEAYTFSIKGVRIANVYPTGNLNNGLWEETGDLTTYQVDYTEPMTVTEDVSLLGDEGDNAMLIPQYTKAWDVKNNPTNSLEVNVPEATENDTEGEGDGETCDETGDETGGETEEPYVGSYISILVQINQIIQNEGEDPTTRRVYPAKTDYAWLAIPVEFNWEPGYKYVYTLNLGTGGGYVDPVQDPDEDIVEEPGEKILGGAMKFDAQESDLGWFWNNYYPETPTAGN